MKIVLLTSDYNLSANIAVKAFLENPYLKKHNIEIAGIVITSPYSLGKHTFKEMHRFMSKCGWGFSWKNIITNVWKKWTIKFGRWFVPNKSREYFDIDELAKHRNIPLLEIKNINSKESKQFMKKFKADYLVSCFLLQIVDKEVLSIPRKGAINVHPALIQNHRGTFTSFWALLKKWKESGATVHFMTEKLDKGKIILQKKFFVHPSDTMHCINKRSAKLGAKLLVKSLIKLKKERVKEILIKKIGQLFTMPTPEDVKRFYSQGRSLIKVRDFFKI